MTGRATVPASVIETRLGTASGNGILPLAPDHTQTDVRIIVLTVSEINRLDTEDAARRQRLEAPGALAAAAEWYVTVAGWPVFPLAVRGKTPATRNGFKNATTDLTQVRQWWADLPQANIGTPTGHRFDVVDIDGPAGWTSLARLRHIDCPDNCCDTDICHVDRSHVLGAQILAQSATGGGGAHLLIAANPEQRNAAKLVDGIDIRGAGGYVVLPPSVHSSGRRYDWTHAPGDGLLNEQVAA